MQTEMARERETRPGTWVKAAMEAAKLDEEGVAVRVKKRVSTVYGWQKKGIQYLDWIGLLTVVGFLDADEATLRERLVASGLSETDIKALLLDRAQVREYFKPKNAN